MPGPGGLDLGFGRFARRPQLDDLGFQFFDLGQKAPQGSLGRGRRLLGAFIDRPERGEPWVDRGQLTMGPLAPSQSPLADSLIDAEVEQRREEVLTIGRLVVEKALELTLG